MRSSQPPPQAHFDPTFTSFHPFPPESLTQGPEPFSPRVVDSGSRALFPLESLTQGPEPFLVSSSSLFVAQLLLGCPQHFLTIVWKPQGRGTDQRKKTRGASSASNQLFSTTFPFSLSERETFRRLATQRKQYTASRMYRSAGVFLSWPTSRCLPLYDPSRNLSCCALHRTRRDPPR
jgi:hypothetical protein